MSRQEKGFSIIGTVTGESKTISSLVWLSPDVLVAGSLKGQLMFVEGGDLKVIYEAATTDQIDLTKPKEGYFI